MKGFNKLLLSILFAILFSIAVHDGLANVIRLVLEIPKDEMGLAKWGDAFFLRILASLVTTGLSSFVLGTLLKERARLGALLMITPVVLFWLAVTALVAPEIMSNIDTLVARGAVFDQIKFGILMPMTIAIASPFIAVLAGEMGNHYASELTRPKSILDIEWIHWLWILPIYLNKVVAVPLLILAYLWRADLEAPYMTNSILNIFFSPGHELMMVVGGAILISLLMSAWHTYTILSIEKEPNESGWLRGLMVFGSVLLFVILHTIFFSDAMIR